MCQNKACISPDERLFISNCSKMLCCDHWQCMWSPLAAILNYSENLIAPVEASQKSISVFFIKSEIPNPCGWHLNSQTWIVAKGHLKIGIIYILISKDLQSFMKLCALAFEFISFTRGVQMRMQQRQDTQQGQNQFIPILHLGF